MEPWRETEAGDRVDEALRQDKTPGRVFEDSRKQVDKAADELKK